MGREDTKLMQAKFLAAYLEHGDAKRAYREAGYQGDPATGSGLILKRPSVQAWLAQTSEAVAASAISAVVEQTKDALQTRDGLTDWLVSVVKGEHTDVAWSKDGPIQVEVKMSDRLKAAELIAKVQGLLAPQKIDVNQKQAVFHFFTPDNGRGGAIPAEVVVSKAPETSDDD